MKILVLNSGSSSVKYKLIDLHGNDNTVMAEGGVEKIGLPGGFLKFKKADGNKAIDELGQIDHKQAIEAILNKLTDATDGCISNYGEIEAVGHRVVHGGEKFSKSVLIDEDVKAKVRECYDIAPLHNPANIIGIEAITALMPNVPQVGVFDTAFHQTMPAKAYMYALPYKYYAEDGVRRYGFHGTSHRYVSERVCQFLGVDVSKQRIITCHIGNGASMAAIVGGKCVDTSMGLTPVEGLMMGTRVGDVDPGALTFLMQKHNLSVDELQKIINKESGMLGVSGVSSDMREIDAAISAGNERAKLALDMYILRITKYIGAYAAEMGGVDIIVFTGGVGENQSYVRQEVCSTLGFIGVDIDKEINNQIHGDESIISSAKSNVKVCVIPTDEELTIARDTRDIVAKA